jgi:uncharacterized protein (TIGR00106 family)
MSVLLEFSMSPLSKGESVGKYVARSLEIIDNSGLPYQLNPMGTVLEGEWDEVFGVVKRCYDQMSQDCARVTAIIKVDARKDQTNRMVAKITSVEATLGRELKK